MAGIWGGDGSALDSTRKEGVQLGWGDVASHFGNSGPFPLTQSFFCLGLAGLLIYLHVFIVFMGFIVSYYYKNSTLL